VLQRLPRLLPLQAGGPVDAFLLALLAVVALAAVFPASGTFADVLAYRWRWCSSAPGQWALSCCR